MCKQKFKRKHNNLTKMQTQSKIPTDLLQLYELTNSSLNKPAAYLELYQQRLQRTAAKRIVEFLDKETLQEMVCYFETRQTLGLGSINCQQFCRNYYQIRQRQQQIENQKSLNLASVLVFTVIKLLCILFLSGIIVHCVWPLLASAWQSYFYPQLPRCNECTLQQQYSVLSAIWPACLVIYTLIGVLFSAGIVVHSTKSYITKYREGQQVEREIKQIVNREE